MRQAAVNGVPLSAMMTVAMLLTMYADRLGLLGMLAPIAMFAVPAVSFLLLRRDYIATKGEMTWGALWLDGCLSYILGAVIAGAVMYIVWRWIDPTWMPDRIDESIDLLKASNDAEMVKLASDMRTAVDSGLDFSARSLTPAFIWLAAFSGSLLSLIFAPIVLTTTRITKP